LDRLCIIKKNLLISLVDPQSQLHLQPSSKASAERLRQNGEHLPFYQTMTWKIELRVANSGQESRNLPAQVDVLVAKRRTSGAEPKTKQTKRQSEEVE